jgi:hypothetical protein
MKRSASEFRASCNGRTRHEEENHQESNTVEAGVEAES